MLDLETMGTKPGSSIVAIGAVKFQVPLITDTFYRRIDLRSCVEAGLTIDPSTVLWWVKQPDAARLEWSKESGDLTECLLDFSEWVGGGEVEVWGNGAAFDNALLAAAYDLAGLPCPWKYSGDRCYRTVKNLFPDIPIPRVGTHHNALDDALSQAAHLMQMIPLL